MREMVFQARMSHQAMAMGVFSAMSSFRQILLTTSSSFGMMFVAKDLSLEHTKTNFSRFTNRSRFQTSQLELRGLNLFTGHRPLQKLGSMSIVGVEPK